MNNIPYIILALFLFTQLNAQKKYPKTYFDNPLKIPVVLSGTFGELRNNHFHSGMDLKTLGKEGIPIYAPADGYVSRIKVAQYGYGKALYINHPNGYTTVYAHLQKFNPTVQSYVKKVQYRKKKFAVGSLYFKAGKFPVKRGEIIGYTGNTGSSGGPHLHYEFRDTGTEKIINPMFFGLTTPDTIPPALKQLMVYPLTANARVNNSAEKTIIPFKKIKKYKYITRQITASDTIGFGINTFDRLNRASNKNGIYSLEMKVNGNRVYYHNLETFAFSESKYLNLLIDYEHYGKYRKRFQKTHKDPVNKLSLYKDLINNGKLFIKPNTNYQVEIIAKDFNGNYSSLTIPVKGIDSNVMFKKADTTAYRITRNKFTKFSNENISVAFPKKTFYHDTFLDVKITNDTAKIHTPTIPLDKKFTLTFNTSHLSPKQQKKVYIANITNKKYPRYTRTRKKENKVYTTSKTLGTYTLKFDYEKPSIKLVNFKNGKWISGLNKLKVKIKDKGTGINNYYATINDEWILMEYEHKKGVLTYNFSDKKLVGTKHNFKIKVADNVGNTKTLSAIFYRK